MLLPIITNEANRLPAPPKNPRGGTVPAKAGAPLAELQAALANAASSGTVPADISERLTARLAHYFDRAASPADKGGRGDSAEVAQSVAVASVLMDIYGQNPFGAKRSETGRLWERALAADAPRIRQCVEALLAGYLTDRAGAEARLAAARLADYSAFQSTVNGAFTALRSVLTDLDEDTLRAMATAQISAEWRKNGKTVPRKP